MYWLVVDRTRTSILFLRYRLPQIFVNLTHDSLTVGRSREEVWLRSGAGVFVAGAAVAFVGLHFPSDWHVADTRIMQGVVRLVVHVGRRALSHVSLAWPIAEGTRKGIAAQGSIARDSRHEVLGSAVARVGRREWRVGPATGGVPVPDVVVWVVRWLLLCLVVALEARKTFVLSNLLLAPDLVGLVLVGLGGRAGEVGLNGGDKGSGPLAVRHCLGHLLAVHPIVPAVQPRVVVFAALQVDVEVPLDVAEPLRLQLVQFRHRDARNLGPRAVLEGVVVEELAAEEQGDGQHAPDLSFVGMERGDPLQAIDALRQVVHSEEDRGLGQAR